MCALCSDLVSVDVQLVFFIRTFLSQFPLSSSSPETDPEPQSPDVHRSDARVHKCCWYNRDRIKTKIKHKNTHSTHGIWFLVIKHRQKMTFILKGTHQFSDSGETLSSDLYMNFQNDNNNQVLLWRRFMRFNMYYVVLLDFYVDFSSRVFGTEGVF